MFALEFLSWEVEFDPVTFLSLLRSGYVSVSVTFQILLLLRFRYAPVHVMFSFPLRFWSFYVPVSVTLPIWLPTFLFYFCYFPLSKFSIPLHLHSRCWYVYIEILIPFLLLSGFRYVIFSARFFILLQFSTPLQFRFDYFFVISLGFCFGSPSVAFLIQFPFARNGSTWLL